MALLGGVKVDFSEFRVFQNFCLLRIPVDEFKTSTRAVVPKKFGEFQVIDNSLPKMSTKKSAKTIALVNEMKGDDKILYFYMCPIVNRLSHYL
jgi:hypothetical protein